MTDMILPNRYRDIGNRTIEKANLDKYLGVPAQIVSISDEEMRPIVYLDNHGNYKRLAFKDDFTKDLDFLRTTISSDSYLIDPDTADIFELLLNQACTLSFKDINTQTSSVRTIRLIIHCLQLGAYPKFSNDIKWIGSKPNFNDKTNSTYILRFYNTSTGWIGEYGASTNSTSSGSGVIITSNNHSRSEWLLPAGSSSGEDPDRITQYFFSDINEQDKQSISDISQNIDDIHKVSSALKSLSVIEDNLENIHSVYENTSAIRTLAESINKIETILDSLNDIRNIVSYIPNINLVAHHIKDKYFLDVKATTHTITGNTILQLDKIVLAPAVGSSSSSSGSFVIDTDSSDGSITPTQLIYSETDIADEVVGDGTIVVSPTSNKIQKIKKV